MPLLSKDKISQTFTVARKSAYTRGELLKLIQEHLTAWLEPPGPCPGEPALEVDSLNPIEAFDALVKAKILEKAALPFPHRHETRYLFGKAETLDLVQSVNREGYFSHFTALYHNHLTEQIPKTIYFNVEQNATGGTGQLTQPALDRAFRGQTRLSANVIEYKGARIWRLNGRNTNQLGVIEETRERGVIRVTNPERTLIDAVVRPIYCGGVAVVAKAFVEAKDSISVNRIAAYLRKLRYTYPYHQAIGYYLERAGYDRPVLELLRQFPIEFDFYLVHGMKATDFNESWRLFIPKGF